MGDPETAETSATNGVTRKVGFAEFSDWAYLDGIMRKKGYVQFMLGETEARCPEEKDPSIGCDTKKQE